MDLELKKQERISYKRRKAIAVSTILLIAIVLFSGIAPYFIESLTPTFAYAKDEDKDEDDDGSEWFAEFSEKFNSFSPENVADVWAVPISYLTKGTLISYMVKKFYTDTDSDGTTTFEDIISIFSGDKSPFKNVTSALKGIAMLLCLIYAGEQMVKELNRGEMTMESWLRIFIAFLLPAILILDCDMIIEGFVKIEKGIFSLIDGTVKFDVKNTSVDEIKGISWASENPLTHPIKFYENLNKYYTGLMTGLILFLLYAVINFYGCVIIISGVLNNYVELGIRQMFMPLAIANIAHDGMRSAGVRYIKKYIGCAIKLATIFIVFKIVFTVYSTLESTVDTNSIESIIMIIVLAIGLKSALKAANQIIDDALGTN